MTPFTPFICIHISILSSFWLILYHHWIVGSIPMNTVATNWGIPVSPILLEQLMMLNTPLFTRTHLCTLNRTFSDPQTHKWFTSTTTSPCISFIPNYIPLHILNMFIKIIPYIPGYIPLKSSPMKSHDVSPMKSHWTCFNPTKFHYIPIVFPSVVRRSALRPP